MVPIRWAHWPRQAKLASLNPPPAEPLDTNDPVDIPYLSIPNLQDDEEGGEPVSTSDVSHLDPPSSNPTPLLDSGRSAEPQHGDDAPLERSDTDLVPIPPLEPGSSACSSPAGGATPLERSGSLPAPDACGDDSLGPNGLPLCTLCMDAEANMRLMPCGHDQFCRLCVLSTVCGWQGAEAPTCPMCRTPFSFMLALV